MQFRLRSAQRFIRKRTVNPAPESLLKTPFHPAIFPGMKCKNRYAPIRLQTLRQHAQQILQHAKLIIHRNAQSLERATNTRVSFAFAKPGAWLVKSVHMVPAPAKSGADWESLWASLTFELP